MVILPANTKAEYNKQLDLKYFRMHSFDTIKKGGSFPSPFDYLE